jgi:hypothetical protein
MKTGKSLVELATELERQVKTRQDFIAPQGKVDIKVVEGEIVLDGLNGEPKALTPYAHRQLADLHEIPAKYYDRMQAEQPELLAQNLNTWLHADPSALRMVRTLDSRVRAVLSPKYRPLDNYELANAVIPTLIKHKVQIVSSELTETRMYIKGILPELSDELPTGLQFGVGHSAVTGSRTYGRDGKLVAAIVISNSDLGNGSLRVEPSVFTTWCTNLAILMAAAMKKYHVGRSNEAGEDFSIYRDETREATDRAFFMRVTDVVRSAFNEDAFKAAVNQIRDAAKTEIKSKDLPTVVEVAVRQLALPVATSNSILTALARGGDLTKWGLSSAITEVAGEVESYEVATQLERAGGEVLALPAARWETIAEAEKKEAA